MLRVNSERMSGRRRSVAAMMKLSIKRLYCNFTILFISRQCEAPLIYGDPQTHLCQLKSFNWMFGRSVGRSVCCQSVRKRGEEILKNFACKLIYDLLIIRVRSTWKRGEETIKWSTDRNITSSHFHLDCSSCLSFSLSFFHSNVSECRQTNKVMGPWGDQ